MIKILANILCVFIPSRHGRRMLRLRLSHPIRRWIRFAKSFSNARHPRVSYTCGYRAVNFVVNIDNKYVFKFPLRTNGAEISIREKRITDALRPISPIKIPKMELVEFDGLTIRKYECINGIGFHALDKKTQSAHAEKIAKQLAKFLYVVGMADPREIRDLKDSKNDKPTIMHGWNQDDLWDNFIMNPKTFDVLAMIDWESSLFSNFYNCFTGGTGNHIVKSALLREYLKLFLTDAIRK
ncbi:MAG: hypothetical protein J5613_00435 [Alphaproteobacteria bacterium]|nr:hypothetical protein [Alphaproteobacteria bacterium]